MKKYAVTSLARGAAACLATLIAVQGAQAASTVNGLTFSLQGLVGVGTLPANLRDEHGETFGSISGLVADLSSWQRVGDTYTGVFHASPDRGYNAAGTIDYAPRINTIAMSFTPAAQGATGLARNQIGLALTRSTRLYEALPDGGTRLFSGLDPVPGGVATGGARPASGLLPELPQGHNGKLTLDAEGIVVLKDGSRLISDEYGPSIYRFGADGKFLGALPVANSVKPIRNGVADYSSNNPTAGQPSPSPLNPTAGRQNNQGFEGLSLSPDGKTLFVALQSATRQDGGTSPATRDTTRVFKYDVSDIDNAQLTGEYVVQLPKFQQNGSTLVAAQSEIVAVDNDTLMMLPRDSSGDKVGTQLSLSRGVNIIDLSGATNILGTPVEGLIAPGGVLDPSIVAATSTAFIDINDLAELARFGLTNGVVDGLRNLSEKWEGMSLVPALDPEHPDDYFLFIANDNDFATTDGFQVGAAYSDGKDIDTMFLAYRLTIAPAVPEADALAMALAGLGVMWGVRRRRG